MRGVSLGKRENAKATNAACNPHLPSLSFSPFPCRLRNDAEPTPPDGTSPPVMVALSNHAAMPACGTRGGRSTLASCLLCSRELDPVALTRSRPCLTCPFHTRHSIAATDGRPPTRGNRHFAGYPPAAIQHQRLHECRERRRDHPRTPWNGQAYCRQ